MSLTVILGKNRFTDCRNVIALADQPLLRVEGLPLRVSVRTPTRVASLTPIAVSCNRATDDRDGRLAVLASDASVTILWDDQVVVWARQKDDDTVHLKVDLRPLGLAIYDDPVGLHIGSNVLVDNEVSNSTTAISLPELTERP